ncbi:hypothetical protein VTN77DRAFT_6355 [Rasamsonia byssochlamydoides]|uniref:uncharacterized protein n=1 Tax=Rasamsonia byssochlamydoides TaxID=89139 RepID=UPI003742B3A9
MFKRSIFTHITPLPPYVPRDAVVEILHNHSEMIELNPLVTGHRRCEHAPAVAQPDEVDAAWYEITDKISYLPGGLLSGKVSYYGCFHDLPRGLQTHIHAPAGLEIRGKWRVCGNMPGEPRDPVELGMEKLRIPREGLYLREDVDLRCSLVLLGIVKKNIKKSHAGLVERLLAKTRHLAGSHLAASHRVASHLAASHLAGARSSYLTDSPTSSPTAESTHAFVQQQNLLQQPASDSRPVSLYSSGHSSSNNAGEPDQAKNGNYPFTRHRSWTSSPRPPPSPTYPESVLSLYNNNNDNGGNRGNRSPHGSVHLSETSSQRHCSHSFSYSQNHSQSHTQQYRHYSQQYYPPFGYYQQQHPHSPHEYRYSQQYQYPYQYPYQHQQQHQYQNSSSPGSQVLARPGLTELPPGPDLDVNLSERDGEEQRRQSRITPVRSDQKDQQQQQQQKEEGNHHNNSHIQDRIQSQTQNVTLNLNLHPHRHHPRLQELE